MLIYVLIVLAIIVLVFFHHGIELDFYIKNGAYTLALYYIVLGRFRVMEIKHIKLKKKKRKIKPDIIMLKAVKATVNIDYNINVLELNENTALLTSKVCGLLESIDAASSMKITQNIRYVFSGYHLNIRIHMSMLNTLQSYISYRRYSN